MSENEKKIFADPTGERGETPYFHGRSGIINDFKGVLSDAHLTGKGTIHLIYGAPGAGKSALVCELESVANAQGWDSVEIDPPALWDIDSLHEFFPTKNILKKIDAKVKAGMGMISVELATRGSTKTIKKTLRSGKRPLLLILDEAQMIGSSSKPVGAQAVVASIVLKALHNGKMGRPIILLAAGLRTTLPSLEALDISRFGARNRIALGALSEDSARGVIRDWIVKDGMAKGDPDEWINAIALEAGVWPRHVHSYSWHAAQYLKQNGGLMSPKGLNDVIAKGWSGRINYYEQRIDPFYIDEIKHVAVAISKYPAGGAFDRLCVIEHLSKIYPEPKAELLFDRLIEKGIIQEKGDDGYHVGIESMHKWLVDAYVKRKYTDQERGMKELSANLKQQVFSPEKKDDQIGTPKDKGDNEAKSKGRGGLSRGR